jgi:hypothetical protein
LNRRSTLASPRDRPGAKGRESLFGWEHAAEAANDDRGSLPNIAELSAQGIHLRREDAARLGKRCCSSVLNPVVLASQRRQEAQRVLEEEELLRANPLRWLYHPAVRVLSH